MARSPKSSDSRKMEKLKDELLLHRGNSKKNSGKILLDDGARAEAAGTESVVDDARVVLRTVCDPSSSSTRDQLHRHLHDEESSPFLSPLVVDQVVEVDKDQDKPSSSFFLLPGNRGWAETLRGQRNDFRERARGERKEAKAALRAAYADAEREAQSPENAAAREVYRREVAEACLNSGRIWEIEGEPGGGWGATYNLLQTGVEEQEQGQEEFSTEEQQDLHLNDSVSGTSGNSKSSKNKAGAAKAKVGSPSPLSRNRVETNKSGDPGATPKAGPSLRKGASQVMNVAVSRAKSCTVACKKTNNIEGGSGGSPNYKAFFHDPDSPGESRNPGTLSSNSSGDEEEDSMLRQYGRTGGGKEESLVHDTFFKRYRRASFFTAGQTGNNKRKDDTRKAFGGGGDEDADGVGNQMNSTQDMLVGKTRTIDLHAVGKQSTVTSGKELTGRKANGFVDQHHAFDYIYEPELHSSGPPFTSTQLEQAASLPLLQNSDFEIEVEPENTHIISLAWTKNSSPNVNTTSSHEQSRGLQRQASSPMQKTDLVTQDDLYIRALAKKLEIPLLSAERVKTVFDEHDVDGSGSLEYPEFVTVFLQLLALQSGVPGAIAALLDEVDQEQDDEQGLLGLGAEEKDESSKKDKNNKNGDYDGRASLMMKRRRPSKEQRRASLRMLARLSKDGTSAIDYSQNINHADETLEVDSTSRGTTTNSCNSASSNTNKNKQEPSSSMLASPGNAVPGGAASTTAPGAPVKFPIDLKTDFPPSRIRAFWQVLDSDRSGAVEFEEFLVWFYHTFELPTLSQRTVQAQKRIVLARELSPGRRGLSRGERRKRQQKDHMRGGFADVRHGHNQEIDSDEENSMRERGTFVRFLLDDLSKGGKGSEELEVAEKAMRTLSPQEIFYKMSAGGLGRAGLVREQVQNGFAENAELFARWLEWQKRNCKQKTGPLSANKVARPALLVEDKNTVAQGSSVRNQKMLVK
ncbi:unnamed protein product [Amoebophrya sp. A25]|nr:unnamed protein product [Amoebophrya sp. A25]|eukprot:GSA25T00026491001.1